MNPQKNIKETDCNGCRATSRILVTKWPGWREHLRPEPETWRDSSWGCREIQSLTKSRWPTQAKAFVGPDKVERRKGSPTNSINWPKYFLLRLNNCNKETSCWLQGGLMIIPVSDLVYKPYHTSIITATRVGIINQGKYRWKVRW